MCSSRNNPYPSNGRSSEIPRGKGGHKSQNFRSNVHCMKLNWNFLEGGGGGVGGGNLKEFKTIYKISGESKLKQQKTIKSYSV